MTTSDTIDQVIERYNALPALPFIFSVKDLRALVFAWECDGRRPEANELRLVLHTDTDRVLSNVASNLSGEHTASHEAHGRKAAETRRAKKVAAR